MSLDKNPSDDPLDTIIGWPYSVRKHVADALKPYIRIDCIDGRIQWLVPQPENDELHDAVIVLATATAAEKGIGNYDTIKAEKALDLCAEIARISG